MSDERTEPGYVGTERTTLLGWLDYHRATLAWKCAGLTAEQLVTRSVPPSSLSLIGLVRHMTDVERSWFRVRFESEPVAPVYAYGPDFDDAFDLLDVHGSDTAMAAWTA